MNVLRTLMVPADLGATAQKITDAIGYPDKGMFVSQVEGGSVVGYISSGMLDDASPILSDAATLHAACASDPSVTLAECQSLLASFDLTDAEPHARKVFIINEVEAGVTASAWVQPTGAQDAYGMDAVVSHNGKSWRNLMSANVWSPGVSGWREVWGQAQAGYPAWVQPTGGQDAYPLGAKVSYNGQNWENTGSSANVWAPGVFGWVVIA